MEDSEIVSMYWDRDEQAINQTKLKYNSYIKKISYNILANIEDCKEVINDTYLAAWNSMPKNRPNILSTYLGKITRQISIDVFRKNHSKKRYPSEYLLSLEELSESVADDKGPEQALNKKQLIEAINSFLRSSSEEERNLFIGRYYYFDSLKQIAGYLGISESKAKMSLFRMRKKLKLYLIKEGFMYE